MFPFCHFTVSKHGKENPASNYVGQHKYSIRKAAVIQRAAESVICKVFCVNIF